MNKRIRSISHTVYWLFLAFSEWASSRLMGERSLSYAANERTQLYLVQRAWKYLTGCSSEP